MQELSILVVSTKLCLKAIWETKPAFLGSSSPRRKFEKRIVYSGASKHMSDQRLMFQSFQPIQHGHKRRKLSIKCYVEIDNVHPNLSKAIQIQLNPSISIHSYPYLSIPIHTHQNPSTSIPPRVIGGMVFADIQWNIFYLHGENFSPVNLLW